MALVSKQFKYSYNNSNEWINGTIFNPYCPIVKLKIEGKPHTKFYVNNNIESIDIGTRGMYDIEFRDKINIKSLRFEENTLNTELIVNIVYNNETVN